MDPKPSFSGQSMIDIVFNKRNKSYGAYFLRRTYKQHLLKAMTIAIGLFIFGLYTPRMAGALGLFKSKVVKHDSTIIILSDPDIVPIEPEVEVEKTDPAEQEQIKDTEITPTEDDIGEDPPTTDEKRDKQSGTENRQGSDSGILFGKGTEPWDPKTTGIETTEEKKPIDIVIVQQIDFIGGPDAFQKFIQDNLVYPENELMYEEEGETEVTFTVGIDGSIETAGVSKSSGNNHFDREAVRLIRLCNKMFRPHKVNGKPIRSVCTTTIAFAIDD